MSAWRRQALSLLPEYGGIVEAADSPMALWVELWPQFEDALGRTEWPLVNRFLRLAAWSVSDESGPLPNDTSTAAVVSFYEHLPQDRVRWQYFPKWFSRAEFENLLSVFAYHLGRDELEELKDAYAAGTKKRTQ